MNTLHELATIVGWGVIIISLWWGIGFISFVAAIIFLKSKIGIDMIGNASYGSWKRIRKEAWIGLIGTFILTIAIAWGVVYATIEHSMDCIKEIDKDSKN